MKILSVSLFRAGLSRAAVFAGALAMVSGLPLLAQGEAAAIVTALPKSGDALPIPQQQMQISVDGKPTPPSLWRAYGNGPVELVLLMDGSARSSFGRNLDDLAKFIQSLPQSVTVGVAYMQNGRAVFAGPITADRDGAAKLLHLPGGAPGSNASPYFCLSELAKRWPAPPSQARREVVMITDGVDEYNLRYDPDDPYVKTAIADAQRAGIVVYSIYYRDQGRLSSTGYETNAGQSYLTQVADETGGKLYYEGSSNPVSLTPFFSDLNRRLSNQYELRFDAPTGRKTTSVSLKVKSATSDVKITAPQHVAVSSSGK